MDARMQHDATKKRFFDLTPKKDLFGETIVSGYVYQRGNDYNQWYNLAWNFTISWIPSIPTIISRSATPNLSNYLQI